MHKAAIVVLADPKSGSEEALGRLFNALQQRTTSSSKTCP